MRNFTSVYKIILLSCFLVPALACTAVSEPLSTEGEGGVRTVEEFLISHLGRNYYTEHFTDLRAAFVDNHTVKASCRFSYSPHIRDFRFTFFFDTSAQKLSKDQVSLVILDPQRFNYGRDKAVKVALREGLVPSTSYDVRLILSLKPRTRLAWDVQSIDGSMNEVLHEGRPHGMRVDVETGTVLSRDIVKSMMGHGQD